MKGKFVILGFFVIVLILIAGCTTSQGGTATVPKTQNPGVGSSSAGDTTSGSSSLQFKCEDKCPNEDQLKTFFPDVAGWQGSPPVSNGCTIHETYYKNEIKNGYHDKVTVTIQDYSSCNFDAHDYYQKYYLLGEAPPDSNNMAIIRRSVTYHGYTTIRTELKNNGVVWPDEVMIIVNPRLSVSLSSVIFNATSPSEVDAAIEKFATAIDFNGIARMEDTLSSNAITPKATIKTTTSTQSRIVSINAKYNPQDGIITITNNGGSGVEDLSYITVSVNGVNLPTNLDAKTGSVLTSHGTANSKNHIIAVAAFKNGMQQLVLDTYV